MYCGTCNTEIPSGAPYCLNCGAPLSAAQGSPGGGAGPDRARLTKIIALVAVLLVLVVGAGILFLLPALQESGREELKAQALLDLQRISDGAKSYFETAQMSPDGVTLPRQFPRTAELTPGKPCSKGDIWPAAPGIWLSPTWEALGFAPRAGHHYAYQFISEGVEISAAFTARAVGDLDCDGILSTFEVTGESTARLEFQPGAGVRRIRPDE